MKSIIGKIRKYWLSIFLVTILLGQFVTKIIVDRKRTNELFNLVGIELHLSTILLLSLYLAFIYKFLRLKKNIEYFILILTIFLIGVMLNHSNIVFGDLAGRVFFAFKFAFLFIAVPVIRNLPKSQLTTAENILIAFGKLNILFILVGLLFGTEILKSYPYSQRFGYNGLILLQGMGSFVYNLLIIRSYYQFVKQRESIFNLLAFVFAGLLLGTKAVIVLLLLLATYHVFFVQRRRTLKVLASFLIVFSLILIRPILSLYAKLFPFGEGLISEHGYLAFLSSLRVINFKKTLEYTADNWDWNDYLFGNINLKTYAVESSIPDLFFFFGIMGLLVFIIFFKKMYFSKVLDIQLQSLLAIFLIVATLSGGFLVSVFNVFIFVLVIESNRQLMQNK